jgi:hypothetical protein
MAQSEARAWWADVQHLRDGYERTDEARRRADEADLAARRAIRERRGVEAEVSSMLSGPRRSSAAPVPRRVSGPDSAGRRGHEPELAAHHAPAPESGPGFAYPADPASRLALQPDLAPRRGGHADARLAGEGSGAPRVKGSATPGRRIIEIRGRTVPAPTVPRPIEPDRRRPPRRAIERVGGRPDRVAMWALLMGLLLILVAIGTADSPAVVSLYLR